MSKKMVRPIIEVRRFFVGEKTATEVFIEAMLECSVRTFEGVKKPEYTNAESEVNINEFRETKNSPVLPS